MHDDLTRLAILHGTDKFGYHDYTPNYHKMFAHLRDARIKVLEIGVGGYADDDRGGQSLAVWRDFFVDAQITGIDIQEKTMDLGPRVEILQGSQVDPAFLEDLVRTRGPFDIIIDDGSHRNEHVVGSFELLFPTLAPGGIYVAEDVQTSFHPRFGGSLELTAPNSVGYFGALQRKLSTDSRDPLVSQVAAMERFHNMIALHKRTGNGGRPDVFASNRFEAFEGTPPSVTFVGREVDLPFDTGPIHRAEWGDTVERADMVIATLGETPPTPPILDALFDRVTDGGVMVVRSDQAAADFTPDGDLMHYLQHRFTMVDHVEMLVHHPTAAVDALAGQIYAIEHFHDAVLFDKSPNTYPSNFAFDPHNPQAAAALAHMGEVLRDSTLEGGLVQYADILTRHDSREAAAGTLARLTAIGATSRQYYQMAGALAQRERRREEAVRLFTAGLDRFPHDPQFSVMLAGVLGSLRRHDDAEAVLRTSLAANPRARNVVAALVRVLSAKGALDEAIELTTSSITLFPQPARPDRYVALAVLQNRSGDTDAARRAVAAALDLAPTDAAALALHAQMQ